jgi:translation initiation factor 1A
MGKNKGKGGKNRRRGKNETEEKRELILKEEGQEYAQVMRMLGNGRLEAQCFDGKKRMCHIRGKFRKRVWVNQGDIVLIGLRDFQDEKGDVILKYNSDEARKLKSMGQLPDSIQINEETGGDEDIPFEFAEDGGSDHAPASESSSDSDDDAPGPADRRAFNIDDI